MRALLQHQVGISALFLLAVFVLPAIARADSDERKVINGATVRDKVVNHKTYIANKGPGPLVIRYGDGTTMATIPAGTALMIQGIRPGLSDNGKLEHFISNAYTKFSISVSKKSPTVQIRRPDGEVTDAAPNTTTKINTFYKYNANKFVAESSNFSSESFLLDTERDELSIVSGN